jgi:hypothetical protein
MFSIGGWAFSDGGKVGKHIVDLLRLCNNKKNSDSAPGRSLNQLRK